MRAFLVKARKGKTAPTFSLRSLAGTSGRLDVVLRSILAAFRWGGGLRRDVLFYALLEGPPRPPLVIEVRGPELESLPASEVELARVFCQVYSGEEVPGFRAYRESFESLIARLSERFKVVYLHEGGRDIRSVELGDDTLFVLGNHEGLDRESEEFLKRMSVPWVSLGPIAYLTSHCIVLVNEELDRRLRLSR